MMQLFFVCTLYLSMLSSLKPWHIFVCACLKVHLTYVTKSTGRERLQQQARRVPRPVLSQGDQAISMVAIRARQSVRTPTMVSKPIRRHKLHFPCGLSQIHIRTHTKIHVHKQMWRSSPHDVEATHALLSHRTLHYAHRWLTTRSSTCHPMHQSERPLRNSKNL